MPFAIVSIRFPRLGIDGANRTEMKLLFHSLSVSLLLLSGTASSLADIGNGGSVNGGNVLTPLPDSGPSILLLALGCVGLTIAARKRLSKPD